LNTLEAYGTALVAFLDGLLGSLLRPYRAVPGAAALRIGINGVDLCSLLNAAANNLRHYRERSPLLAQVRHANLDRAYLNVATLAKALGLPAPARTEHDVAFFAQNYCWRIIRLLTPTC
jgi:hypothetical protein